VDAATARAEIERRLLVADKNTATTPLYVAQAAILGELAVGPTLVRMRPTGRGSAGAPRMATIVSSKLVSIPITCTRF
jgi:hypothetical protein